MRRILSAIGGAMTRKEWLEQPIFLGLMFLLWCVVHTAIPWWKACLVGALCGVMRQTYHWSQL